jgi:hypothetical protein
MELVIVTVLVIGAFYWFDHLVDFNLILLPITIGVLVAATLGYLPYHVVVLLVGIILVYYIFVVRF